MEKPLPLELKKELTQHPEEEIAKTGELTGINLDHWLSS